MESEKLSSNAGSMIKVRYIGDYYNVAFDKSVVYDAEILNDSWYRIYVDLYEDYGMFSPEEFEIVSPSS